MIGIFISIALTAIYSMVLVRDIRRNRSFSEFGWGFLVGVTTNIICGATFYLIVCHELDLLVSQREKSKAKVAKEKISAVKHELWDGLIMGVLLGLAIFLIGYCWLLF